MWWHHWREKRTFFQWMNSRSLSLSGVDASACSSTFLRSRRNDIIAIANADYIICAWRKRQFSQLDLVTPKIQGGEQSVYSPYFEELFDILLGHHYFASQTTNSICTAWYHSPLYRMRFQIFSLLYSLSAFVLATGKLDDKSNIEDITASFNLIFDRKHFDQLGTIFTPDVTYNPGTEAIQGLPSVISLISTFPNTTTTYTTLGTQLIKFRPPFDKEGRSKLAESVSYSTFVNFGNGNLTGQTFVIFARYVDKEIFKTNEPGFGGWRFKNRKFEFVVSSLLLRRIASNPSLAAPGIFCMYIQYVNPSNL